MIKEANFKKNYKVLKDKIKNINLEKGFKLIKEDIVKTSKNYSKKKRFNNIAATYIFRYIFRNKSALENFFLLVSNSGIVIFDEYKKRE